MEVRQIPLTKGAYALVDAEDYERLSAHKWCLSHYGYAVRRKPGGGIEYMHRVVLDSQGGLDVDHINGSKLDNRKLNLRRATRRQNLLNKCVRKDNRLGIKGIRVARRAKTADRYEARINSNSLGTFNNVTEAVEAYNTAARKLHGEFANLNRMELLNV